jgi:glycosyltransferase involved in cell wall biosynthesis
MNLLFLSKRFLYPIDTGGKIRTAKILEKLKEIFDITLVSNVETTVDGIYINDIERLCKRFVGVEWKERRKRNIFFYVKIFIKSFSKYPISVVNDKNRDIKYVIYNMIMKEKYDILVCDFLQSSINIENINGIKKILFHHNIENIVMKRHYEKSKTYIERIFWLIQWKKMQKYERKLCKKFDGIIAVSDIDKNTLEKEFRARNVFSIPTGIDTAYFHPQERIVEKNSLVFTGSMDWLPNEDAILFFARDILGEIKSQIPDVKLTVVGRNPSRHLCRELRKYPEIRVVGWVNDVRPFISSHALYIVPLRIGGGTRIKIYEAMAMGKAVVSTHIGTEGLPVVHGKHVLLVDAAEDFAQTVVKLLMNPQERRRLEVAARDFVRRNCSWEKAAVTFADACRKIVNVY